MKKNMLFVVILCVLPCLYAQDFTISFTGSGASNTVTTVKVENLTKRTTVFLNGNDILSLSATTGIRSSGVMELSDVICSPNPMHGTGSIDFRTFQPSPVTINLFDLSGRLVCQTTEQLTSGHHTYSINGLKGGVYILKVSTNSKSQTTKLINSFDGLGKPEIKYGKFTPVEISKNQNGDIQSLKNADHSQEEIILPYDQGDMVRFTGMSDDNKTIVMFDPMKPLLIHFIFEVCADGDNNRYTVVQIGTQTWMAENLRTTKYADGNLIPLSSSNSEWKGTNTASYCWYQDNAPTYKIPHGALYNWYAVNAENLAPVGWHVPTSDEWNTLINYLDYAVAGKKLKAEGDLFWHDDPSTGRNESGFSAIPGGYRNDFNGSFGGDFYQSAYYWTSTLNKSNYPLYKLISSYYGYVSSSASSSKKTGFSVRCIKNK